jgi:hypothetical protein
VRLTDRLPESCIAQLSEQFLEEAAGSIAAWIGMPIILFVCDGKFTAELTGFADGGYSTEIKPRSIYDVTAIKGLKVWCFRPLA